MLTIKEMGEVDAEASRTGTPVEQLVERAGAAVATEAVSLLGHTYGQRVVVIAGPGNNGADGRVAGRLLEARGMKTTVIDALGPPEVLPACDLVIDAAFGTGFRGEYRAPDPRGAPVLAVDVPTGVDADTGIAGEQAVRATVTVSFGALKAGLLLGEGRSCAGRVKLWPIGLPVPGASECGICLVEDDDIVELLAMRGAEAHKWQTALGVVAGAPGMYGAPSFVSRAASRAGAGMVRLGIPGARPEDLPISEAVSQVLPSSGFDEAALDGLDRCKALVVGPGLGHERPTRASVRRLVAAAPVAVVVDADGLAALGEETSAAEVIAGRGEVTVLTPHEAEFARLAGGPPAGDRIGSVRRLASVTGAVVLLKGSTTIVSSPEGRVLLTTAGSSRLATAGTGDVLSGIIGAFIARGMPGFEAAGLAAHVHARAAGRGYGDGLVAGDLPELVAEVLSEAASQRDARAGTAAGANHAR
ncbi:MAG: NAD(P)H-hydrate dehydratase [Acidimicrobiales bacterium]